MEKFRVRGKWVFSGRTRNRSIKGNVHYTDSRDYWWKHRTLEMFLGLKKRDQE